MIDKLCQRSLIAFFLLSTLGLFGQRVIPQKQNPLSLFELIPIANQGFISIYTNDKSSSVHLLFTGASETVESKKEISLLQRGLTAQLESAFLWENQLVLLTSLFYPGPERDLLFIRRYSIPEFKEVDSELITEAYVPGRLRIPFGYALSPDSTKIMCYSWTYASPKDSVKLEIQVLDRQLNKVWGQQFEVPNKNENFYVYSCKIDNDANAYLLCEDYKGKPGDNARIRDENIERFILHLDEDSKEVLTFPIELSKKNTITSVQMTIDKQGNLIGGGFYKEANKLYQAGIYTYRINRQTQAYQKWEIPVSKEDYLSMHPYANASGKYVSGTHQFRDFQLDYVLWDEKKGLTLIAEQRVFESTGDRFRDILLVQLDTSLKKKWIIRIPKKQAADEVNLAYASYQFLQRDNKQYVLFTDHKDNIPTNSDLPKKIKEVNFIQDWTSKYSIRLRREEDLLENWSPRYAIHLLRIEDSGVIKHQNLSLALQTPKPNMSFVPGFSRSDQKNTFLLYLTKPYEMGQVFPISWVQK